ncbi:ribosomal protein L31 [Acrasis kona]|uniref:Ribosomal protein L31 n=1 Tax=Acrasis kona TaxID=1008807 RepID=A0AAW2YZR8_9EUKA
MPSKAERQAFFKKEKKVRKGVAKPLAKKKAEPLFLKRQKRNPKSAKETGYEVTYNVLKNLRGSLLDYRANRCIREIKRFVRQFTQTSAIVIAPELNQYIWSQGKKNPPRKIRLHLERKPFEDEERAGKYFTHVGFKLVKSFKGLKTSHSVEESA